MGRPPKKRPNVAQPEDPTIRYIPLTRGQIAIVSTHRFAHLMQWNWSAYWSKNGNCFYATRRGRKGEPAFIYMHRYIAGNHKEHTDHQNKNTLDNRDDNLRPCTNSQNQGNRDKQYNNTSGYKGVFSNGRNGWMAKIAYKGQQIYGGTYSSKEDAARAYDILARLYFGEFARLNFPHA